MNDKTREELANSTKRKADAIIKVKGFTAYGVSAATTSICEAIIYDQRQIYPVSHWQKDLQCCLSLPAIIGRAGIVSTVKLALDENENKLIAESVKDIRAITLKCMPENP
jgi:L-lactate dehydrogenase